MQSILVSRLGLRNRLAVCYGGLLKLKSPQEMERCYGRNNHNRGYLVKCPHLPQRERPPLYRGAFFQQGRFFNTALRREEKKTEKKPKLKYKLLLLLFKLVASYMTQSCVMYTDFCRDLVMCIYMNRSLPPPDKDHPYGYFKRKHAWRHAISTGALFHIPIWAVFVIYKNYDTSSPRDDLLLVAVMMGPIVLMEVYALLAALPIAKKAAAVEEMRLLNYLCSGNNHLPADNVIEAVAALTGAAISGISIALLYRTGSQAFDIAGSVMVTGLSFGVNFIIKDRNEEVLIGKAMPDNLELRVIDLVKSKKYVKDLHDLTSEVLGESSYRMKLGIEFDSKFMAECYLKNPLGAALKRDIVKAVNQAETLHESIQRAAVMASKDEAVLAAFQAVLQMVLEEELLAKNGVRAVEQFLPLYDDEIDKLRAEIRELVPELKFIYITRETK